MYFQRSVALAVLTVLALGPAASPAAWAQEGGTPPNAEKYKDWTLVCSEADANAPQVCEISTVLVSNEGKRLGALALASVAEPGGENGRMIASALVPLGVDLRSDATLTIGGAEPLKLDFLRCLHRGCEASAPIPAAQQTAMRAGSIAKVAVSIGGEQKATFDFSLAGFSAAHDALKKRLGAK